MNLIETLLDKKTKIIHRENLLFEDIPYTYAYNLEEQEFYNQLVLFKQKENKYMVCAFTYYESDDDYLPSLDAYDRVPYPLSFRLKKEFDHLDEAKNFYKELLSKCPKKLDLKDILPDECNVYGFNKDKNLRFVGYDEKRCEKEVYEKEFVRHGYQRVMIRAFRFDKEIVINKKLKLEFKKEEECERTFHLLKEHFEPFTSTLYSCENEETELNQLLEAIFKKGTYSEYLHVKLERDFLDRIINLHVGFQEQGASFTFKYQLPTRNGKYHGDEMEGSIHISWFEPNQPSLVEFYEKYERVDPFKDKLKEILKR